MNAEATQLIPVESVNALEIFKPNSELLKDLLQQIETTAKAHVPDTSTEEGRKAIASVAYKVARSKTTIDDAGKDLVAGMKKEAAVIDERRKYAREYLDRVKEEVRAPLNEWEAEEARKAELARQAAELELLHMEALRENEMFDREAEIKRERDELARLRAEQEERDRQAAQAERDRKLKEEAEERGRQAAAAALQREQEARQQAEARAKEAEEKAERDRLAAVQSERDRADREAKEAERVRREAEEKKRREEAAQAADQANRARIHGDITQALLADGHGERTAEKVLRLLVSGGIPHVRVNYS